MRGKARSRMRNMEFFPAALRPQTQHLRNIIDIIDTSRMLSVVQALH